MRIDGRNPNNLREIKIIPNATLYAEGSVLVEFGRTRVLCNASVESNTPKWLQGSGSGWVTAEYGMIPRSTHSRMDRGKIASGGRTQEISRLIGRSLRASVDLKQMGDRMITVDCDVLQADGGTRTAAITGGFVALALALHQLKEEGLIKQLPLVNYISAVSVGLLNDQPLLDLCYEEDVAAETDMNVVMTGQGQLVEIQGTAESKSFSRVQLLAMLDIAEDACQHLVAEQAKIIGDFFPPPSQAKR